MRARQRVAEQKMQGEGEGGSMFSQYLSILTVAIGSMSLKDLCELTMYQMYDLVERYTLYLNWDLDVKSRLAGGKPDKPADSPVPPETPVPDTVPRQWPAAADYISADAYYFP